MSSAIAYLHKKLPFRLPQPGQKIISEETGVTYEIGHQFAQGYFGTVYACSDDWGHSLVAKVLEPSGSPVEMESRAHSEVLASHIVRSPHIVHVHDAFIFEGAYYIISERCLTSLRELLTVTHDRSTWFSALAKALLHAVHYMHTRALIHGDIHSGNVFLHRKTDAIEPDHHSALDFKLGDFGQTRHLSFDHLQAMWNLTCVPPEVLDPVEFGPVDHRADIYQVGLLFLQILQKNCDTFTKDDILAGAPRQLAENLAHPASTVIACMLRRHSSCRCSTALETWKALNVALMSASAASSVSNMFN
jgi:serine/threonine protein kinase